MQNLRTILLNSALCVILFTVVGPINLNIRHILITLTLEKEANLQEY